MGILYNEAGHLCGSLLILVVLGCFIGDNSGDWHDACNHHGRSKVCRNILPEQVVNIHVVRKLLLPGVVHAIHPGGSLCGPELQLWS